MSIFPLTPTLYVSIYLQVKDWKSSKFYKNGKKKNARRIFVVGGGPAGLLPMAALGRFSLVVENTTYNNRQLVDKSHRHHV